MYSRSIVEQTLLSYKHSSIPSAYTKSKQSKIRKQILMKQSKIKNGTLQERRYSRIEDRAARASKGLGALSSTMYGNPWRKQIHGEKKIKYLFGLKKFFSI